MASQLPGLHEWVSLRWSLLSGDEDDSEDCHAIEIRSPEGEIWDRVRRMGTAEAWTEQIEAVIRIQLINLPPRPIEGDLIALNPSGVEVAKWQWAGRGQSKVTRDSSTAQESSALSANARFLTAALDSCTRMVGLQEVALAAFTRSAEAALTRSDTQLQSVLAREERWQNATTKLLEDKAVLVEKLGSVSAAEVVADRIMTGVQASAPYWAQVLGPAAQYLAERLVPRG